MAKSWSALGIGRAKSEVHKSLKHSLTYNIMALMSVHLPSARSVIVGTFWRALSVTQPALPLWGRILLGMSDPGGSTQVNTYCNHLPKYLLRSGCDAKMGNRRAEPSASSRFACFRYHPKIVPAEMLTRPLRNFTLYIPGNSLSGEHGILMVNGRLDLKVFLQMLLNRKEASTLEWHTSSRLGSVKLNRPNRIHPTCKLV